MEVPTSYDTERPHSDVGLWKVGEGVEVRSYLLNCNASLISLRLQGKRSFRKAGRLSANEYVFLQADLQCHFFGNK